MKGKKHGNQFDLLVEKLTEEFLKVPNVQLINNDSLISQIFNRVTFRIADITSYKNLVAFHFVPAVNKAIFQTTQELRTSKYRSLMQIKESELKETLHDTIRLSYVGLFHKFENFVDDLVAITEQIMWENVPPGKPLEKYIKEKFDFNIRHWGQFPPVYKINWISNCTKHKDGFPYKEPVPVSYMFAPMDKKIQPTLEEFQKDCEALLQFVPTYFRMLVMFAQYQAFFENKLLEEHSEEFKKDIIFHEGIIRGQMISMVHNLKLNSLF